MDIPLLQVDAFADAPFTGNPAAVCLLPAPRDPACEDRLECGNGAMMAQLQDVLAQDYRAQQNTPAYPFRFIPRRHNRRNARLTHKLLANSRRRINFAA